MLTALTDGIAILQRKEISNFEKVHLFNAYLALKFNKKSPLRFLDYAISYSSRTNCFGILREIFFLGDYAFKNTGKAPPRILDVGANIGIATLYFKRYFPTARITAFEAMPENIELLQKNVANNNLKEVDVVHGFIGKSTGTRRVHYNPKNPGSSTGIDSVAISKGATKFVPIDVPAIRISDYVDGEIDLLKMDVEGAEGEILEELETSGALPRIKSMVFEYHANSGNSQNKLNTILEILERNNFATVIYDNENGFYGKALQPFMVYHFMIRAYRNP